MKHAYWGPALLGMGALLVGGGIMGLLLVFKRVPTEATIARDEKAIHVTVQEVHPEAVPVQIQGYGEVAVRRTVSITPQVPGKVVAVHPALVVGGTILEGEELFALDPRPYAAQVADAQAQLSRQESALERLRAETRNLEADLKSLRRNGELAAQHFARAKQLYEEGVGSQSAMDEAERSLIDSRNEIDKLGRNLTLYPIRMAESESEIESARARLDLAQVDLEHTRVVAPFTARVAEVQLEKDEIAPLASSVVVLADDSVLEIAVPLNSRDARLWLPFATDGADATGESGSWFGDLPPVSCQIRWTEETGSRVWEGTLHRVERYDKASRTLTVVVRVTGDKVFASDRFPLVEGMFCEVTIPGRTMEGVYRLAPHVVSFENTVFVAEGDRLKTVAVEVMRIEEEFTFVSGGLSPGDQVITTRLVNPLDQSLLSVTPATVEPGE